MSFAGVSFQHPDGRGGVRELDLVIPEGELWIAGPSGAGKTTFLDLVSGLLQPQTGDDGSAPDRPRPCLCRPGRRAVRGARCVTI